MPSIKSDPFRIDKLGEHKYNSKEFVNHYKEPDILLPKHQLASKYWVGDQEFEKPTAEKRREKKKITE